MSSLWRSLRPVKGNRWGERKAIISQNMFFLSVYAYSTLISAHILHPPHWSTHTHLCTSVIWGHLFNVFFFFQFHYLRRTRQKGPHFAKKENLTIDLRKIGIQVHMCTPTRRVTFSYQPFPITGRQVHLANIRQLTLRYHRCTVTFMTEVWEL